jgi:hypothetical protein
VCPLRFAHGITLTRAHISFSRLREYRRFPITTQPWFVPPHKGIVAHLRTSRHRFSPTPYYRLATRGKRHTAYLYRFATVTRRVGIYDVTLARQITLVLSNGCSISLLPILRWYPYSGGAFRSVRYYSFTSFVIHHILATSTLPHTRRVVRGVIALRSVFVRSLSVTEAPPLYVNALYTISPILPYERALRRRHSPTTPVRHINHEPSVVVPIVVGTNVCLSQERLRVRALLSSYVEAYT